MRKHTDYGQYAGWRHGVQRHGLFQQSLSLLFADNKIGKKTCCQSTQQRLIPGIQPNAYQLLATAQLCQRNMSWWSFDIRS